jgi:hypothetical protein
MEMRLTKQQVGRGTQADGESFNKLALIKRVSELRATYQIRLLVYRAVKEEKKLIIDVPKECKLHDDLKQLLRDYPRSVEIVRS